MIWGVYLLKKGMLLECLKFAQISEKWKRHAISDSNDKIVSMLGNKRNKAEQTRRREDNKQTTWDKRTAKHEGVETSKDNTKAYIASGGS